VLVGIQVPECERGRLAEALAHIGYEYWEETANPAYALFLR